MDESELNDVGEQMNLSTSFEEDVRSRIRGAIREFDRLNDLDLDGEDVDELVARLMSGGFNALNSTRD